MCFIGMVIRVKSSAESHMRECTEEEEKEEEEGVRMRVHEINADTHEL